MLPMSSRKPANTAPTSARAVALRALHRILGQRRPFDEALERDPGFAGLETRDRGFAWLLVSTVLRRLGQIDAAVTACLAKPLTPKAREAENILRLGAAQLLFLGTPAHAAVGETVTLTEGRLRPYAALVNAVLRRLAGDGPGLVASQDAPRLNTPGWLWATWVEEYGEAGARAIAAAHGEEPPLDLSVKGDAAAWAERLGAELLPTGSLRYRGETSVAALPGYAEGAWWVQDAAAALPARLFGEIGGKLVIDLCAAPGGKTLQLAAAGARVIAVDRSAARLAQVAENLARTGLTAQTVVADAAAWRPPAPADCVLLDAPCSATGTIRRHPDIPHVKTAEDIVRLVPLQDRLLEAAADMVAPGGRLVYCVCSLQSAEGSSRIESFLGRQPRFRRVPLQPGELGGADELITPLGELRTAPFHFADRGGMDGFYACRLDREP